MLFSLPLLLIVSLCFRVKAALFRDIIMMNDIDEIE